MLRYVFRALVGRLVGPGLPLAATAVFALTGLDPLGYALCGAGLVFLWSRTGPHGLGQHLMQRAMIVSAVLVDLAEDAPDGLTGQVWPLTVTALGLLCLIAFEPLMVIALRTGRTQAVNLAVSRTGGGRLVNASTLFTVVTALTAVYVLCAAFTWSSPVIAAAVVLVLALCGGAVLNAWRVRRRHVRRTDTEVHAAVAALAPTFMLHVSATQGSDYQVTTWLPYLDATGEPYIIVVREKHLLRSLAQHTDRPIVFAEGIVELENLIVGSLKAVLYVNNGGKNVHCIRFTGLTHVFIGHGDSDKASSFSPMAAIYDQIWVAGQAGVDRYARNGVEIPPGKFRIVGRPQLAAEAVGPRTAPDAAPTVLYTPTWAGAAEDTNYSSLGIGHIIVSALIAKGVTVVLRPHPYVTRNPASAAQLARVEALLAEDAAKSGRRHLWGDATGRDRGLVDCVNLADAMISDVSGVVSDWLYSERPVALTDMRGAGEAFAEEFPLAAMAYTLNAKADDVAAALDGVIDAMLGEDPMRATRVAGKHYYLGDIPADRYAGAFGEELLTCVRGTDAAVREASPEPAGQGTESAN